jgi:hypothetical protein
MVILYTKNREVVEGLRKGERLLKVLGRGESADSLTVIQKDERLLKDYTKKWEEVRKESRRKKERKSRERKARVLIGENEIYWTSDSYLL